MEDAEIEAEIEDFHRGLQAAHVSRHAGRWGPGAGLVEPERLERDVELIGFCTKMGQPSTRKGGSHCVWSCTHSTP
jgi:hypothetical protein